MICKTTVLFEEDAEGGGDAARVGNDNGVDARFPMMAFEVLAICRVLVQFGLITCCYVNIIGKGDVNENYALEIVSFSAVTIQLLQSAAVVAQYVLNLPTRKVDVKKPSSAERLLAANLQNVPQRTWSMSSMSFSFASSTCARRWASSSARVAAPLAAAGKAGEEAPSVSCCCSRWAPAAR